MLVEPFLVHLWLRWVLGPLDTLVTFERLAMIEQPVEDVGRDALREGIAGQPTPEVDAVRANRSGSGHIGSKSRAAHVCEYVQ